MKTCIPLLLALSLLPAQASDKRFAFSTPSLTSPAHELELENYITLKNRPHSIRKFEFKHELEYGLTDRTQIGLYLANWYTDRIKDASKYQTSGLEIIHNLSNPITAPIGSALYGEVLLGDRALKLEGKLILEKRIGQWSAVWNGIVEAEWEGNRFGKYQESSGEIEQTFGIGYDVTKQLSIGVEALHAIPLKEWERASKPELYIGPSVSFRTKGFFAAFSTLFQTTNRTDEPSLQARLILGFDL